MKKFISIISLFAIVAMLCISASASSEIDNIVLSRIDELVENFEGKYFTVNGSGCRSWIGGHGCYENCLNTRVVNSEWFKEAVEKLSWNPSSINFNDFEKSSFYGFDTKKWKGTVYTASGYSCHGFATVMTHLLFDDLIDSNGVLKTERIGTFYFNSDCVQFLEPGDYLRLNNSHSVIYVKPSDDGKGIVVLDNNSRGTYNCLTSYRTFDFNSYRVITITRCADKDKLHRCSFNNCGMCDECGAEYPLQHNTNSSYVGDYSRRWFKSNIAIKDKPYAAANTVAYTGSTVTVLSATSNRFGNTWLKVSYDGYNACYEGYVYVGDLEKNYKKADSYVASKPDCDTNVSVPDEKPYITDTSRIIGYGSSGNAVKQLQICINYLIDNGIISSGRLVEDGIAGNATVRAIRECQACFNLGIDGLAGSKTYNAINNAISDS